ncbi:uncharacterized protein LOC131224294 [Magnolia sinica]|uniref:uncharacterized protein LOC131224294 n=1 Tax=Magnolia sinica TaxID=86752 RepID=UPI00265B6F28|nr:uncharacterized protein LOC131224294 [Magnolia sinica]
MRKVDKWTPFVDGLSNSKRGAGIVLVVLDAITIQYAIRVSFRASNNKAKYEALLDGLRLAAVLGVQFLNVLYDSQLIVNQVSAEHDVKEARMIAYLGETRKLMSKFQECNISHIPRAENSWADALAKLASGVEGSILRIVLV